MKGHLPVQKIPPIVDRPVPGWWFLGCHGGAGTSTLNSAIVGGIDAGRYWPVFDEAPLVSRVVLVTRTHASGLRAAQAAARQWASGAVGGVQLLGLVTVADAPGRLPRPLRDLLRLVSGGLPRVWEMPWVEAWRLGDPPSSADLPPAYVQLAADLKQLVPGGEYV